MAGTDWDKEMKKIDKQLESISDDALVSTSSKKSAPAEKARAGEVQRTTTSLGVFARLMLAVVLGLGMLFWPCSAVWTWRHRSAQGHVLSLLLIVWGLVLAGLEILPRTGYATPTSQHPATWMCS